MYRGNDTCNHWRQLASCRLDGELTEFEARGLERHRARCADCATWACDLGDLVDAIQMSEPARPRELVSLRLLRHRTRAMPAFVAASASIGAAFLAVIAIALPGRGGLVGERPGTGVFLNASMADPPPRSLVLASLTKAEQPLAPHVATGQHALPSGGKVIPNEGTT